MKKLVEIRDLNFSYSQQEVFRGAHLDIFEGDYLAVVGANGSGKSTLVKLLTGQLASPQVRLAPGLAHGMGYLPQTGNANPLAFPITCMELVLLELYQEMGFFKLARAKQRRQAEYALESVQMLDKKDANFHQLSGGQKQRVLIAKALVKRPQLLIFDEPMTGVDDRSREVLLSILKHLNESHKKTIVMVTHDPSILRKDVNRMVLVKDQEIKEWV